MGLNKEKIKIRVAKAIHKLPTTANIKRDALNDFKEAVGTASDICTVVGLYHRGNTTLNITLNDGGKVKSNKKEYLMIVYDSDAQLIKEGDYFMIGTNKYVIQDLGNNHDIYLDMLIEKV